MPNARASISKDARTVLERTKDDLERRRGRRPSDSDAILELARVAGKW